MTLSESIKGRVLTAGVTQGCGAIDGWVAVRRGRCQFSTVSTEKKLLWIKGAGGKLVNDMKANHLPCMQEEA